MATMIHYMAAHKIYKKSKHMQLICVLSELKLKLELNVLYQNGCFGAGWIYCQINFWEFNILNVGRD